MSGDIYLGLDLGTSGCKLIAFDGRGRELARATRAYGLHNPGPGLFELDLEDLWNHARACFAEIDPLGLPGRVRSLSVSHIGEAIIPVDKAGKPLCLMPIHADTRALAEVEEITSLIPADELAVITGHAANSMLTLPKLMWWRKHRPDMLKSAWKLLCVGDFVLVQLGLAPKIDGSSAGRTLMFDVRKHAWDPGLVALSGARLDQLAEPVPGGANVGIIPDRIAAGLRLPPGVVVAIGGHDQPMGALGAGVIEPGSVMYSTGTTEAVAAAFGAPAPALAAHSTPCYPHVVAGQYVGLVGSLSGGRVLSWLRGILGPSTGFDTLLEGLEDRAPDWPLLLPHFVGSGTTLNDEVSLGALYGLTFETRREDIVAAVLEGITLEQALSLHVLAEAGGPIASVRAIGGGARSPYWLQMKADILGKPVTRVAVTDAPCLGAAILGRRAVEPETPLARIVGEMVAFGETYQPRPERHRRFAARLDVYRALYAALRPVAPLMRAATAGTA